MSNLRGPVTLLSYLTALWRNLLRRRGVERDLDDEVRCRSGADHVAILSEAAARQFWPGQQPIGQQIVWHKAPRLVSRDRSAALQMVSVHLTVVGVAADFYTGGRTSSPFVYLPLSQEYETDLAVVARSRSGARLTNEIRDGLASVDPNLPVVASSRLADGIGPVHVQLRIAAAVAVSVGAVGLLLAAIGVFGVTAYTVTRRTREIGVRIALGAGRSDIVRMVLRHGMTMVLTGSTAGLLLAVGASRLLKGLLFGVPPLDPVSFGAAIVLFAGTGLAACCVPVLRAVRIHPVDALRSE